MNLNINKESLFTIGVLVADKSSMIGTKDLEKSTVLSVISKLIRCIASSGIDSVNEENGWHLYKERIDPIYHQLFEEMNTDKLLKLVGELERESVHQSLMKV